MVLRKLLLMSSSSINGFEYLQHVERDITGLLHKNNVKRILFIPYALFDFDKYTKSVSDALAKIGFSVEGIHTHPDPVEAILQAESIFIGGGNTFKLLSTLYEKQLIDPIREVVLNQGVPYLGTSAGTNVATKSIKTTNDMPILYPPSFDALNLVPFNINPHYLDPIPNDTHCGETREKRIKEFHRMNAEPVLGLREGTLLHVEGDKAVMKGFCNSRLFLQGEEPREIEPDTDLSFLLREH